MQTNPRFAVIGAGIVGVCCALRLQARGFDVCLFDPREPGSATSFGNAGVIADSFIMPYSTPGLWKQLPGMLLSGDGPLKVRWPYFVRGLPWLLRFMSEARVERTRQVAAELATLGRLCQSSHRELMREHDVDANLMKANGVLKVYRDPRVIENHALEHEVLREHGFPVEVLDGDELRQLEPGLSREFRAAEFLPVMGQVAQSVKLTEAYFEAFVRLGGRHIKESARRFEMQSEGPKRLITDLGIHDVDQVLIAAGAWSRELVNALGIDVPLDTERGYHISVDWCDELVLNRPVMDGENFFVMAPMLDGVRVTSGTEIGGLSLPPDFSRVRRILGYARASLPKLTGAVNREWMGYRPSMPDSKPVIGRSPRHAGVFFAFGHGHLGLTQAAITSKLIEELVMGVPTSVAVAPFSAERFA